MAKQSLYMNHAYGGISSNEKIAIPQFSARFVKNLDLNQDLSSITQNPTPSVVTSTTPYLIKWIEKGTPWSSDFYAVDAGGNVYKNWVVDRSASDIVNAVGDVGAAGQGLLCFNNYIYYMNGLSIGRYGRIDGTPAYNDDFLSDGTTNIDQSSLAGHANTYTLPTSISETATATKSFTPTRDPIKSIQVWVTSKGTGNVTVTLHDSSNNVVGSKTIANASLANGAYNTFTLPSNVGVPIRTSIGVTYHFHVTVSTGTTTVGTATASDLSTVDFKTVFAILVYDADWHSSIEFLNGIAICNERYLAFWDEATYNPNRLTFAPGFKARTVTKTDEWLVIGCWKGNNIDSADEGRLYFWGGISSTFDYFKTIPMGSPNALQSSKNRLFGIYGSRGGMYLYGSSLTNQNIMSSPAFTKIMEAPRLTRGKKIEVFPGAITDWREQTVFGMGGFTDDTAATGVQIGLYEYGNQMDAIPEALDYGFTPSHGVTTGTSVQIGAVKSFGDELYFSWRNNATIGVDKITKSSNPATSASYESLIFDNGKPQHEKLLLKLVITCLPLQSGDSLTLKYKTERAGSWTSATAYSTVGGTQYEWLLFNPPRFKELEVGYDIATSTNYVTVTGFYLQLDDLAEEAEER